LYEYDAVLERLARDLEHLTAELRPFIQEEAPWWAGDTSPGMGRCPPPIPSTSELV
jgi:hypothetical protein